MHQAYRGIVFFDLDSTLLNRNSQLSPSTLLSLQRLQENHYLPVINTGRAPNEILAIRQQAHLNTFCALNGSYIEHNGQVLYKSVIPTTTITSLVNQTAQLGDALAFYSTKQIATTESTHQVAAAYHFINTPVPLADKQFYYHHRILMLLIFTTTNDLIYHRSYPHLTLYRNTPYSIDTVQIGNSKHSGMLKIQESLHLEGIPTFAFGDGTNDVSMITGADHGVAMANGIDDAKKAAEFITSDNDHDGIRLGLEHFGLI
ncbi:MAG: Cof-type HAD-IIB family hydrolase [Lactobacillus sp.]|jgi:Cof subfamily protein (haloacid dehalogenase superfamily)|nr:Cof-type HAD-IIB family hydrolase [Lactobacillus sp.]